MTATFRCLYLFQLLDQQSHLFEILSDHQKKNTNTNEQLGTIMISSNHYQRPSSTYEAEPQKHTVGRAPLQRLFYAASTNEQLGTQFYDLWNLRSLELSAALWGYQLVVQE